MEGDIYTRMNGRGYIYGVNGRGYIYENEWKGIYIRE